MHTQYNFDHPDAFDNKELADVLRKIKTGSAVEVPEYDFVTHQRSTDVRLLPKGIDVVIMEGILVFHDESARNLMNMKVCARARAACACCRRRALVCAWRRERAAKNSHDAGSCTPVRR